MLRWFGIWKVWLWCVFVPNVGRLNYDPNVNYQGRKGRQTGSFGRSQRKEEGIKMMTKLATGGRARGRRLGARGGAAIMGVGNSYVPSRSLATWVA